MNKTMNKTIKKITALNKAWKRELAHNLRVERQRVKEQIALLRPLLDICAEADELATVPYLAGSEFAGISDILYPFLFTGPLYIKVVCSQTKRVLFHLAPGTHPQTKAPVLFCVSLLHQHGSVSDTKLHPVVATPELAETFLLDVLARIKLVD